MAETVLPVPLDELEDENQMILNDLEFSQKKIEFLENYRKLLIEFSAKCVCNQNKPLIISIESLETQCKQLFNIDDEIECKPEVFDSENDFQEISETKLDEIFYKSDGGTPNTNPSLTPKIEETFEDINNDNNFEKAVTKLKTDLKEKSDKSELNIKNTSKLVSIDNLSQRSGNSVLVFDQLNNIIVRKSALDINRRYESVIEKLVLREEPSETPVTDANILSKGMPRSLPTHSSAVAIPSFIENSNSLQTKNTILRKSAENFDEINESLIESFVLKEINSKGPQTVRQLIAQKPKEQVLPKNPSSRWPDSKIIHVNDKNATLIEWFERREEMDQLPKTSLSENLKTYSNPNRTSEPKSVPSFNKRKQTFADKPYEPKQITDNHLKGETSAPPSQQQYSQRIKENLTEVIDLPEDIDCDEVTDQTSTEPQFINLVSTQSSNTCSYKYLCQPVVSQSPHIKFQIPRDSSVVPKGVPSALVMPAFKRPPTLVPIVTLPSTLSTPIIIPEGSNLYFVPNETQPLSTQMETQQMPQNNSQKHFSRDMKSKPNKLLTEKSPKNDKIHSNMTKEPTYTLRTGLSLIELGSLESFKLKRHELCEVYMQKEVSKEDREESIVMYRCVKCDYKTNRTLNIDRHVNIHHNPNRFTITKLRQMIASGDCFLTPSDRYGMCSVIRRKCVNQENGQTVMGSKLGFKCNYTDCRFISQTSDYVLEHLRVHKNGNTFECDICEKLFGTRSKLTDHKNSVHNIRNNPPLKCDFKGCSYQTHLPRSLKLHTTIHRSERPYICKEKDCDKRFKNRHGLLSHKAYVHSNENKIVQCNWPGCNKTYSSRKGLAQHIKGIHKQINCKIECDLCGKVFNNERRVAFHKKLFHNINNKPWFKCPHCPYKTVSNYETIKHSVVHKTRRTFKCDQLDCNKSFKWKISLEKHKTFTHSDERPYPCDWPCCDFAFKSKPQMERHIKNIHLNNDNIRFWCDYCDTSFKYKGDLNRHIKREH